VIAAACPRATVAVLTGPGFAEDLAAGLPTALTLACADEVAGRRLQADLSTPALRLYRTADVTGAELGGALKNVVAIAAGAVMGAGLGLSARAAIITRGQAEMMRLAAALGGRAETLAGLSGLGDLVLTCTSERSRNTRFGMALGRGEAFDPSVTVEGAATSLAAVRVARAQRVEMPIAATVAALVEGRTTLAQGMADLLSRPLTME
jgi:glycerol-3-phosphate dehydrogenase (NAD(P)+)